MNEKESGRLANVEANMAVMEGSTRLRIHLIAVTSYLQHAIHSGLELVTKVSVSNGFAEVEVAPWTSSPAAARCCYTGNAADTSDDALRLAPFQIFFL